MSPAVPLFFAAALGALIGLVVDVPAWPVVALALLCAAAAIVAGSRAARASVLVLTAFSVAAGAATVQRSFAASRTAALLSSSSEHESVIEGVVDDVSFTAAGARLRVHVSAFVSPEPRGADGVVDVLTSLPPSSLGVAPGDRVRVRGKLRALAPALSPGALDPARLGVARGIDARLSLRHPLDIAVVARSERLALFPRLRLLLRDRLMALLPPRLAGLELALLVGDTSLLDDAQREIYRRVGAGHLLAVSGLQVSLIALLLQRLALAALQLTSLGRVGRGRALASLAALAGVWSFVLLCGAPPSALRAAAMASALLAGSLLRRRVRALDALGVAGLFTVLASPGSVLDPSFLLSYAAVLGLAAAAAPRAQDQEQEEDAAAGAALRLGKLRKIVGAVVIASIGAGVVTLPLSAWLFGEVAPAGLVANIVLVPAATVVQVPALALGLLGALVGSSWIAWLGAQAALLLESLAAGLGDVLPGLVTVDAPSGLVTLLLIALAVLFAAAIARKRLAAAAAVAAGCVLLLFIASREPAGVRIAVLPVGQGDGAVVEFPDGQVMVIDAGGAPVYAGGARDPGAEVVVPFLRRRGIERIDVMVMSHPHPDHAQGLVAVAAAVPVRELWQVAPWRGLSAPIVRTTPDLLGVHRFGTATVEVVAPAPAERTPTYPELGANDNSIVMRICFEGHCALWPGDVEALGEELLPPASLKAEVVKAPHHGSRSSSTEAFVRAAGAADVIFCTGRDNAFGFPHEEVVKRWKDAGARTWDTAVNGEITVRLTASGAHVHSFR